MYVINKELGQITREDLQELIDNEVIEAKTLEYKAKLPGDSDSEKKEFLADVSSFANASGGDIIYGINVDKSTGKLSLDGLTIDNIDKEKLRLDSIIRDGIEPRISLEPIHHIELGNSIYIIIIRIPRSWRKPHRIKFQEYHKFYSRASNGKYLLDVGELRTMFNLSDTLAERIKRFREERISNIIADETFIPLGDNPKIVLHLIPLISFELGQRYDIGVANEILKKIEPIHCSDWDYRYNLDGFLSFNLSTHKYAQIYRNGIIESISASMINPQEMTIPSISFERKIIESLSKYLSTTKELFIETPIILFLSLLSVKGYNIENSDSRPIDRDNLLLPEATIESYDEPADKVLKPCFDSIWNACGLPRDLHYDVERIEDLNYDRN